WIAGWGVPAILASLLLGLFGGPLDGWALAAILFAVALWHVLYRSHAAPAQPEPTAETDVPVDK
ncbi:MAG: hypothetical protein ACJ786_08350, partial [Catenulispora sp.]